MVGNDSSAKKRGSEEDQLGSLDAALEVSLALLKDAAESKGNAAIASFVHKSLRQMNTPPAVQHSDIGKEKSESTFTSMTLDSHSVQRGSIGSKSSEEALAKTLSLLLKASKGDAGNHLETEDLSAIFSTASLADHEAVESSSVGFASALGKPPIRPSSSYGDDDNSIESGVKGGMQARGEIVKIKPGEDGEEDQEVVELEEDIFSLMIVADYRGFSFLYSIMVFCCQITMLALIIYDLLGDDYEVPFNLPVYVEPQVSVAQVIALVIAVLSQDDMRTTLSMVYVGYDQSAMKDFPGANRASFILASSCRFLEGILICFVSFVFVVQSDTILDIFMNFAAVSFIGSIDNLAYELAAAGYVGKSVQKEAEGVKTIEFPVHRPGMKWLSLAFFYTTIVGMLVGWGIVRGKQNNGILLSKSACPSFDVRFGDEVFVLPQNEIISFDNSFRKEKIEKVGRFDSQNPPHVLYSYFSGEYYPKMNDAGGLIRKNERPVYKEDGDDDPSRGTFYYCASRGSWVFTIPILATGANALPKIGIDECGEWGWLMASPPTEEFRLEHVPVEGWVAWTGETFTPADLLSFTCTQCSQDTDCDFTHGSCVEGYCECYEGWSGWQCDIPQPFCPRVRRVLYGETAEDYAEEGPYTPAVNNQGTPRLIYERPVYISDNDGIYEALFFTGRRWFLTAWNDFDQLEQVLFKNFHAYWDSLFWDDTWGEGHVMMVSDATFTVNPDDPTLSWFGPTTERSLGTSRDIFSSTVSLEGTFHCERFDCTHLGSCGNHGVCVEEGCSCNSFAGGPFCQYSPTDAYTESLYGEMLRIAGDERNWTAVLEDETLNDSRFYRRYWRNQVKTLAADEAKNDEL